MGKQYKYSIVVELMANIVAEYVWIDGDGNLRSKARTVTLPGKSPTAEWPRGEKLLKELPEWNYDGSSTKQAEGKFSEIIIKPRYCVPCPFRRWKCPGAFYPHCPDNLLVCVIRINRMESRHLITIVSGRMRFSIKIWRQSRGMD